MFREQVDFPLGTDLAFLKFIPQFVARPMQSAADRAGTQLQGFSDRVVVETFDAAQDQNRPVLFTQGVQCLADLRRIFTTFQFVDGGPVRVGLVVLGDGARVRQTRPNPVVAGAGVHQS